MTIDRYTKAVLTLIGIALAAIAVNVWITPDWPRVLEPRMAQAQPSARQISLPKDWGKAVGFIPGHVYLEAADGTIRLVAIGGTIEPMGTISLLITRK